MTATSQSLVTRFVQHALVERGERAPALAGALGLKPRTVQAKLRGDVRWSVDDLDLLARYFGISVDRLLRPTVILGGEGYGPDAFGSIGMPAQAGSDTHQYVVVDLASRRLAVAA